MSEVTTIQPKDLGTSSQRWWLMVLLVTGMVICYAQRGALPFAAPTLIKELQISKTDMGFLLSAFFFLYSFMQMPAGWLVDRFGVKKAYALGFIVWSIAAACTGFAGGFYTLIVFQLILGVGQSVAFPASARAVANWFQNKERGIVTASYLTGVRVGQALAGAIGAYFLARYSWKLFFLVIGLVPILWFLPWYKFLSKWDEQPSDKQAIDLAQVKKRYSFTESLALLKNRTVFGIFLGFFAYDYVWFVYTRWLAGYLKLERNFSDPEMGVWTSVPFLVMSVVIVFSGFLSDYLIRRGYSEITVRKTFIVIGLFLCLLIVPAGMVDDRITSVWLLAISLCGLGVAIYARDWANFSPAMVERLTDIPTLVAWKDGQGDIRRYQLIINRVGERLHWIGGAGDDLAPSYYGLGIRTYTSSLANIAPKLSLRIHELASQNDSVPLNELMAKYVIPHYAVRARRKGYEVSVVKAQMDILGMAGGSVRPPLVDVTDAERVELRTMLESWQAIL